VIAWWNIRKRKKSRKLVYGQLQQQRIILQEGIAAHARIIEIEGIQELLKGYVELKAWVVIRLQEKLLYQLVHTMIPAEKVPAPGAVVPVRVMPDDTSSIMIMS
jgi:hypothetical protein